MSHLIPLLTSPPADLILIHEMGLANAPDDPVGAQTLTLSAGGSLTLEWSHRGRGGCVTARVAPQTVSRIFEILLEGGFPDVEWIGFPPGPSFRILALERGEEELARVFLARSHYERTPPWDGLCAILDSLCVQLRGPLPGFANTLEPVVTDIQGR